MVISTSTSLEDNNPNYYGSSSELPTNQLTCIEEDKLREEPSTSSDTKSLMTVHNEPEKMLTNVAMKGCTVSPDCSVSSSDICGEESLNSSLSSRHSQSTPSLSSEKGTLPTNKPKKEKLTRIQLSFFVFFEFCVMLYMGFNFGLIVPLHVRQFVTGNSERTFLMAFISTTSSASSIIFGIVTGLISDRILTRFGRRKPFILVCSILMAVTLLLRSAMMSDAVLQKQKWVDSRTTLIVMYVALYWIGNGAVGSVMSAFRSLIPDIVHDSQMGVVSGLFGFTAMLGMIFGLGIFGILKSHIPVWSCSCIVAGLLVPSCFAILFMFKEPVSHFSSSERWIEMASKKQKLDIGEEIVNNVSVQDYDEGPLLEGEPLLQENALFYRSEEKSSIRKVLSSTKSNPFASWNFSFVFLSRAFFNFGTALLFTYTLFFFSDTFQNNFSILFWSNIVKDAVQANSAYLVSVLGMSLVSSVLCGLMSDALGKRFFIFVGTTLVTIGLLGTMIVRSYSLVLVLGIAIGLGVGCYHAVDTALVTSVLDKENAARDLAIWNLSLALPHLIATPIAGVIIGFCDLLFKNGKIPLPHMGYTIIFLIGACCQIMSLLLMLLVGIPKKGKTKASQKK